MNDDENSSLTKKDSLDAYFKSAIADSVNKNWEKLFKILNYFEQGILDFDNKNAKKKADLFGSLAESTSAALVVSTTSIELIQTSDALYFESFVEVIDIYPLQSSFRHGVNVERI